MTAKGYSIVQVSEISDPETYAHYRDLATAAVAAHGGRFIVRGGAAKRMDDGADPGRIVINEFPSLAAAQAWYDSPEYQEALALRLASSTGTTILIEGTE
jgi:uncharacterized protein (DUF1330 family)